MYMKKNYFIFAAALMALASCQTDDYLGNNPGNAEGTTEGAIRFDGGTGKITRATKNTGSAAEMLDGQFKIYGVKSGETAGSDFKTAFDNYILWDNKTDKTTSNSDGWEYVGTKGTTGLGTGKISLSQDQTIKYWDYSAADYRFVAGSPAEAFTYTIDETTKAITSATIKGLAGHIKANSSDVEGNAIVTNPIYVASPVIVSKSEYNSGPVTFTFVRQQSKVRVGVYETIPGYSITKINFYAYDDATEDAASTTQTVSKGNNIILTSATKDYFVGGSNVEGKITYGWDKKTYSLSYTGSSLEKSQNWYAGELKNGVKSTSASNVTIADMYGSDKDMDGTTGYFTVMPTVAETAQPILIKCNYTLTSDDNKGETINVTGATAAIPAAFSKWETNTQYTYLFKISQNTNGTTGKPGESGQPGDPAGLFPITFDAAVAEVKDGTSQGTITSVTTPSITTKQEGSVTADGIEYKAGKPITVNVTESTNGTDLDLKNTQAEVGYIAVYKYTTSITEAELQLKAPTGTPETSTISDKTLSFTPSAEGYYVIQYLTTAATSGENAKPAVYTYKVVYVNKADTNQPTVSSGE